MAAPTWLSRSWPRPSHDLLEARTRQSPLKGGANSRRFHVGGADPSRGAAAATPFPRAGATGAVRRWLCFTSISMDGRIGPRPQLSALPQLPTLARRIGCGSTCTKIRQRYGSGTAIDLRKSGVTIRVEPQRNSWLWQEMKEVAAIETALGTNARVEICSSL